MDIFLHSATNVANPQHSATFKQHFQYFVKNHIFFIIFPKHISLIKKVVHFGHFLDNFFGQKKGAIYKKTLKIKMLGNETIMVINNIIFVKIIFYKKSLWLFFVAKKLGKRAKKGTTILGKNNIEIKYFL